MSDAPAVAYAPEATPLSPAGTPAPWFVALSRAGTKYHLNTVAGRYILVIFPPPGDHPLTRAAIEAVLRRRAGR
jgi:hypothetical protein